MDVGTWHYITGTADEVLTELKTVGIKAENIANIADSSTSAVFYHGRAMLNKKVMLESGSEIA